MAELFIHAVAIYSAVVETTTCAASDGHLLESGDCAESYFFLTFDLNVWLQLCLGSNSNFLGSAIPRVVEEGQGSTAALIFSSSSFWFYVGFTDRVFRVSYSELERAFEFSAFVVPQVPGFTYWLARSSCPGILYYRTNEEHHIYPFFFFL